MTDSAAGDGHWFCVHVALVGRPPAAFEAAGPDLADELAQRPHRVWWETTPARLHVEREIWGHDPHHAAGGMAEELFEVACAVVGEFDAFHVEHLGVDSM